jgi:tellurite resistance protein
MQKLRLPVLPEVGEAERRAAIRQVVSRQARDASAPSVGPRSLTGRLPSVSELQAGALLLNEPGSEDAGAARHFLALLESAYLVAAADGVSAEELSAMGRLIAEVTGSELDEATLLALFTDFEAALKNDGRSTRVTELAECFDDFMAREEALGFAALMAAADGCMAEPEAEALVELGGAFGFSAGEVQLVLDQVGFELKRELQQSD